ncbi:MAG: flagellar hook-basal body complex protein FliE [Candidatus Krumholzibacteriia bacterium]
MSVGPVRSLGSIDPRQVYGGQAAATPRGGFASQLSSALQEVNRLQVNRDDTVEQMVRGEMTEVHDVMVAAEEAQLAFELMLEVRNKLLESYQEIMRMQV